MKYLLSNSGKQSMEALRFTDTLYAFDFDGTLAPIVANPDDARMSAKNIGLLKELNKLASVAVISGRSLTDLKKRLPFRPKYLVGNHGLEGVGLFNKRYAGTRKKVLYWRKELGKKIKKDPYF